MKTILLLLLSLNCFAQFPYRDNVYEYGITKQQWVKTDSTVFCLFETDKLSDYVDLKVKVLRDKVQYPYVYIFTHKGNYAAPIYKINKRGYSIIRLFYRDKNLWIGIDSGIKYVWVKTDRKWLKIKLNTNLSKLKNYDK